MSDSNSFYTQRELCIWKTEDGTANSDINRQSTALVLEKEAPVGRHPFHLSSLGKSNWIKGLILFEELLTLAHKDTQHDALLINIAKRSQFGIGFV